MRKIAIILLLSLCMCVCFTGCSEYADAWQKGVDQANHDAAQARYKAAFEVVYRDVSHRWFLVRDTLTDVLYLHDYSAGGFTVLIDTDGTPLLYPEWLALRDAKQN